VAGFLPGLLANWKKTKNFFLKTLLFYGEMILPSFLIIFLVVFNWNYFKTYGAGPVTDEEKFSGEAWRIQQAAGIVDYLPKTVRIEPQSARRDPVEVMGGEGNSANFLQGTNWAKFDYEGKSQTSKVRINILYFPQWKVFVDGRQVETYIPDEELWGRFWVDMPAGKHLVYVKFFNTPVRTFANIVTVLSLLLVFVLIKKAYKKNHSPER
jgi:hypothetical protein